MQNDLIDQLLDGIEDRRRSITAIRGPKAGAVVSELDDIARVRGRPLVYPFVGSGIGNGALVELADGSVKWDFITGIGTNFFGHGDRQILRVALTAALSDVPIQGHLQPNREYVEFLAAVSSIAPGRCRHVWPSMSGSMANENALKMIRQKKHPAHRVLAFAGAFAGRSAVLSEITDNALNKKGQPVLGQCAYIPFYDAANPNSVDATLAAMDTALRAHPREFCALHVELVQGEGGFREAPQEFFEAVFDRCRKEGVAIWVDEIQTFGRTGEYFMLDRMGLADWADVVTIGKMLHGSAVLFSPDYNPEPGLVSGTFAGYTAGLALGCHVIHRLRTDGLLGAAGKIRILEKALVERMRRLETKGLIRDFTVVGAMAAVTPRRTDLEAVRGLVRRLFDTGLCTYYAGHDLYRLRLLPPGGCLAPSDLTEPFEILECGLQTV